MNNIVNRFMETQQDKAEQVAQEQPMIDYIAKKAETGFKKGITTIAYGLGGELTKEEQEDYERRRNEILEIERQTDDLYSQNKDTLYGVGWLTGELAEALANPYEMVTNIGIGVATGGSSIGVKLISNILADAYVNRTQTKTIYDREPTLPEYAIGGAMSVLPDVAGYYIGKKMSFNSGVREVGDSNVNVRAIKESIDDEGLYDGATKLAYQTQNNINYGADIADTLNINNPKYIDDGVPTFLQRREKTYYEKPQFVQMTDVYGNKHNTEEVVSFFDSHQTKDYLDYVVKNNIDEINAYSDFLDKRGDRVTLQGVRDTIKGQYVNYDRQRVLVADEYVNILGKKPQEYLDEVGYDNKNLAQIYATGFVDDILDPKEKKFWQGIIGDRDILSAEGKTFRIDDLPDPQSFIDRNRDFIYDNGNIRENLDGDKFVDSDDFDIIARLNGYDPTELYISYLKGDECKTINLKDIKKISRTEFVTNKKEMLADAYDIFDTSIKKGYIKDFVGAKLKADKEVLFDEIYEPMFSDGVFKGEFKTKQDKIDFIYNLYNKMQRSTSANYGTDSYIPFAEIADMFSDVESFNKFFFRENGKYIKNNSQLVRDILEEQTKEISMLETFGTTSASRIRNRVNSSFNNKNIQKMLGKDVLSEANVKAVKQVKDEIDVVLENAFFKRPVSEMGAIFKGQEVVRNTISRGVMWMAGAPEAMTNPALAAMRALKYGESASSAFSYGTCRAFKRMAGATPTDLPNKKYAFAKMAQKQRLYKNESAFSLAGGVERFDRFGAKVNEWSDVNISGYGDVYATSIIHNLKDDINIIDPEVKRVLRTAGITESNYGEFVKYAKDHINRNGDYINSAELLELSGDEMADSLRTIFNTISDDIGNVKSNSIFRTQAQDELSKWLGMFRSFARFASADILNDMAYYTTKEGLKKSRLSIGGLKSVIQPKTVWNTAQVAALMYVGGKGAQFVKDVVYGDRDFSERWALAKTRFFNIPEGVREEGLSWLVYDFIKVGQEQTGLDIDMLKAQAPIISTISRIEKSWKDANKDYQLDKDDLISFGLLLSREIITKRGTDFIKATYDTHTEKWDESKRIYDFSPEQNQRYFQAVFQTRVTIGEIKDAMEILDKKSNVAQAEADYLEDKTDSFDKLPEKAKSYFNNVMETANISKFEADAHKAGFALIWNQSTLETDKGKKMMLLDASLREEVGVTTQDVDNYMENKLSNFDNLSDKKKDYYQKLMRYMGKEDTIENQIEFYERLGNAKAKDVEAILKQYYNVDINQFYKSIGVR